MASNERYSNGTENIYKDFGLIFISPIIGIVPSLVSAFNDFKERGMSIESVDIFEGQGIKKGLKNILGLTLLPGSHKRRVKFANNYNESLLFEIMVKKIEKLRLQGRRKIILGGMSGGFIFASRMAQTPPDSEVASFAIKIHPFIKGLFGISPLIFYPSEVSRVSANLELIPSYIPTSLVWGDGDVIIPKGTISYAQRVIQGKANIKCVIIQGMNVGKKTGDIKHQFFGGRDFVNPLTNVFWNAAAEKIALKEIDSILRKIQ